MTRRRQFVPARMFVFALGIAPSLASSGCGDDAQAEDDETSSSSGATADTEMPGGDESSSEATTDPTNATVDESSGGTESSGGSESTTGAVEGADIRVLYELDADDAMQRFDVLDVVDGAPGEPITFFDAPGVEHQVTPSGDRWLAFVRSQPQLEITAVDLSTPPPFTTWALEDALVGVQSAAFDTHDTEGSRWVFRAVAGTGMDLYLFEIGDDGPSAPWHVDADLPDTVLASSSVFALAETRLAFSAHDELTDTGSVWLGPVDANSEPAVMIAEASAPGRSVDRPLVDPAGETLVYTESTSIFDQLAFVVDLASDPIGPPAPVGMVAGAETTSQIRFAPDGSGFAARQSAQNAGADIVWIRIADGAPLAPVQLTSGALAGLGFGFDSWSSDARWAALGVDDAMGLYLVRFDAGEPATAVPIAGDGVAAGTEIDFAPDASYAYFSAMIGTDGIGVHRVTLDGIEPGAPELVSEPLSYLVQFQLADDGRSLFYIASTPDRDAVHAFWVDLSAAVPAKPVRIDPGVGPTDDLFVGKLSATGTHVLYTLRLNQSDYAGVLVDTATIVEQTLADGAPIGMTLLRELE